MSTKMSQLIPGALVLVCALAGCGEADPASVADAATVDTAVDAAQPEDASFALDASPDAAHSPLDAAASALDGATLVELAGPSATITNSSWFNIAWDTKRNVGYATNWGHDLWRFDGAAWSLVLPGSSSAWHNCSIAYDAINDRLWETVCASETDPPSAWKVHYVDLAAMALAWHALDQPAGPSYDPALVFDPIGKRLVAFGGWTSFDQVKTLALDPIAVDWATLPLAGPMIAEDSTKMTNERAGWDTVRAQLWYVHSDGALWTLDQGLTTWTRHATTGEAPPAFSCFGHDPHADRFVAWYSGATDAASVDDAANRAFYVLDPSTLVWAKLGGFSALPTAGGFTTLALVYDPPRAHLVLKTNAGGDNYDPQTWALTLPTP